MAKTATKRALTDSEAPEQAMAAAVAAQEPRELPDCEHCNVQMRLGATGVAFCPSCYRVERSAQVAP